MDFQQKATETTDGRWQMADGRWQMADGRWQMADGRWQMADGRWAAGRGCRVPRQAVVEASRRQAPRAALLSGRSHHFTRIFLPMIILPQIHLSVISSLQWLKSLKNCKMSPWVRVYPHPMTT